LIVSIEIETEKAENQHTSFQHGINPFLLKRLTSFKFEPEADPTMYALLYSVVWCVTLSSIVTPDVKCCQTVNTYSIPNALRSTYLCHVPAQAVEPRCIFDDTGIIILI
jgi:hypothetical protein